MARSKPVAFILDIGVFMSIKTAFDDYVKVAEENVKKLDQTLKEGEDRLEQMKNELKDKVEQLHRQIIELQCQIAEINRENSKHPDGPHMSTAGLESMVSQLEKEKDIVYENSRLLIGIHSKIHNRMYDYSVCKEDFEDLVHSGFEEIKSKLQTLEGIVENYTNTRLTL